MAAVEMMLSTIFCTVPAFSRVEPAMTSGPVRISIGNWASAPIGVFLLQARQAVSAPTSLARRIAPMTYGVRPLAEMPRTASRSPTPSRSSASAPAVGSSSTFSWAEPNASCPPAMMAAIMPSGTLNVGAASAASSTPIRPAVPAPT